MKLSIIVPVYNVQDYVEECIKSLLSQSLKEIEIIVVNDGSKDESLNIIKKINDSRIKIINQENKGLSGARNMGIYIAKGEYITFVDSDDFILDNNAYKNMIEIITQEDSDIVIGKAMYYYSKDNIKEFTNMDKIFFNKTMKSDEYFERILNAKKYHAPVCFSIYRKSIIDENKIKFKEGFYHEDEDFTPKILLASKKISYYNRNFYAYRQREKSITSCLNNKKGEDLIKIILGFRTVIDNIENNNLKLEFGNYLSLLLLDTLYKYSHIKFNDELKIFLTKYTFEKNTLIRLYIISINLNLYRIVEKYYRKIRGVS